MEVQLKSPPSLPLQLLWQAEQGQEVRGRPLSFAPLPSLPVFTVPCPPMPEPAPHMYASCQPLIACTLSLYPASPTACDCFPTPALLAPCHPVPVSHPGHLFPPLPDLTFSCTSVLALRQSTVSVAAPGQPGQQEVTAAPSQAVLEQNVRGGGSSWQGQGVEEGLGGRHSDGWGWVMGCMFPPLTPP